jgi:D-glycero-beta-D-manno-heptose 1-phosphate adenylyltransferase
LFYIQFNMDKLEVIRQKIISQNELDRILSIWHFHNFKIVFTNGCFDILHRGHIEYLSKAAALGDILIIGLNSDQSVKNIKGPARPVQDQETRALILASLQFVSKVVIFEESTPYELIKKIQPDVLVKGADYKPENIVGYDIVNSKGGEIVTIEFVEGQSSTELINKLNHL